MTTYTVQMQQVDYIVGEMNSITQKLNQTLQTLDDQAKMNLSQWSSDAMQAYQVQKARWDAAAAEMTTLAARATSELGEINNVYAQGEKQGVSLWEG
jgi:WXG100 family type VII secretion target